MNIKRKNIDPRDIGKYDKSVKGKKAVLKVDISFNNDLNKYSKNKKHFPAGTIVVAEHEVIGTGLTTFNFRQGHHTYQHVVREGKFEYLDE